MSLDEGAVPAKPTAEWDVHWPEIEAQMHDSPSTHYRWALLAKILSGQERLARVLDVGCGSGSLTAYLAGRFPRTEFTGIDESEVAVRMAQTHRSLPNAHFQRVDLDKETLAGAAYSHVLCSEVIEHIDEPVAFLNRVRTIAPQAHLVVSVPGGPRSSYDLHVGHRRHYTKTMLLDQLQQAGYTVTFLQRAGFPFHNLYRLLVFLKGNDAIQIAQGRTSWWNDFLRRTLSRAFDGLYHLNLPDAPWGWQLLAVAAPSGHSETV